MASDAAEPRPALGFIGTGVMGGAMVGTLVRAGFPVLAFDVKPGNLAAAVADGAVAVATAADVVRQCDRVLVSLRSSHVFVEVAERDLLPNARPGQVFVDFGTTRAGETRRLSQAFADRSACLIDAPVSGGRHGCATGTLHIFIGGEEEAVRECLPLFEVLGRPGRVVHSGPSGAGQVVKAVNQLAMGLADAAYLEAIAFGVRAGVSPEAIRQAVGGEDGWRAYFAGLADRAAKGTAGDVYCKYPEFPYFLDEAAQNDFAAPLLAALDAFLREAPHDAFDNMSRPEPPLWRELLARGWAGGDLPPDWDERGDPGADPA